MKKPAPAWDDVGAAFLRAGVPIDLGIADAVEVELPLAGGEGVAPSDLEAKRRLAASVRELYDDVFAYRIDEGAEAPAENAAPAAEAAPEPVEVQAFDRRTGAPIKVKVNMQPQAASSSKVRPAA